MLLPSVLSTDLWKLVYFLERLFKFPSGTSKCFIRGFRKFLEVSDRGMSGIYCSVFHVLPYGAESLAKSGKLSITRSL